MIISYDEDHGLMIDNDSKHELINIVKDIINDMFVVKL